MRKAQVTIYIILGIVIIALISLILLFNSRNTTNTNEGSQEEIFTGGVNQQYLNSLIQKCAKDTLVEGQKLYGLNLRTSPPLIERYMQVAVPACLNDFKTFESEGFTVKKEKLSVSVEINKDSVIAEVTYPVIMKKGGITLTFNSMSYTLPRLITEKLTFDKPTRIVSADGDMVIDIPAGTRAYLDGKEIFEVGIKTIDRNFNGLSNSVLAGSMAFNGWPHGTNFSKPVKMTYYYSDAEVPPLIKEENMKIGFYSDDYDFWVGLPTTVDPVNNVLTVETTHFSVYGSVVKCGGGTDPLHLIITPSIIREACTECDDDKWAFDETNSKNIGQLYHTQEGIECDEESVTYWDEEDDLDDYECVAPATPPDAPCEFTPKHATDALPEGVYTPTSGDPLNILKTTRCDGETRFIFYEFKEKDAGIAEFTTKTTEFDDKITVFTLTDDKNPVLPEKVYYSEDLEKKYDDALSVSHDSFIKTFVQTNEDLKKISTACDGRDSDLCQGGKIYYTNAKYGDAGLCVCAEQQCAYTKAEDLKGRQVYEVKFENMGDSCFAAAEKTGGGGPKVKVETGGDSDVTERETVSVDVPVTEDGKQTIQVDITPICYDDDECVIKNAHFINDDKRKNTLEFTVETTNKIKDNKADPCLLGAAKIEFKGSGLKAEQHLLCTEKAEGTYDLVEGKCKECIKNPDYKIPSSDPETPAAEKDPEAEAQPQYIWSGDADPNECIYIEDDYCAASLIGKKDLKDDVCRVCTFCPECLTINGKWVPYDDCGDCYAGSEGEVEVGPSECNNGALESGEDCDGDEFDGYDGTCIDYDETLYASGNLDCDPDTCEIILSGCVEKASP